MTLLLVTSAVILLIKLPSALLSITSKCGQYIWSTAMPKSRNTIVSSTLPPNLCLSGYLLANPKEPVSTCSEDEEVTKPIQEAGNVTKIKMDP